MPSQIRFFLDEHIPSAVAAGLARRGVDVLTVQEAKRREFELLLHAVVSAEEMQNHVEYL